MHKARALSALQPNGSGASTERIPKTSFSTMQFSLQRWVAGRQGREIKPAAERGKLQLRRPGEVAGTGLGRGGRPDEAAAEPPVRPWSDAE